MNPILPKMTGPRGALEVLFFELTPLFRCNAYAGRGGGSGGGGGWNRGGGGDGGGKAVMLERQQRSGTSGRR